MQDPTHVLVVDDDEEIRDLLARFLAQQNFKVSTASDCRSMLANLSNTSFDLIVLDVMLPDGSGVEVCRDLRKRGSSVPIILLTALKEEIDRIVGLEVGADDYLGKPFSPRELAARIRAVLRRQAPQPGSTAEARTYHCEAFQVDPAKRRVLDAEGLEIDLTAAEFDLLHALVVRPGRVLSREQLLNATNGRESDPFDRSVDVLLSRLRRKLPEGKSIIKTIRNGGYQLAAHVDVRRG